MTFEEFFNKKKIDLVQLRRAKPDLYEEFHSHYAQMGEKSFDHTKKYWFNQLRKDYLLKEQPIAAAETPATKPIAPATAAMQEPVAPVPAATKPTGFKPRFKAGQTLAPKATETLPPPKPDETNDPTARSAETPAPPKPLGFKPRFKAGVTAAPKPEGEEPTPAESKATDTKARDKSTEDKPQAASKPAGFKPRFKPGITNANKNKPE